MVLLLLFFLFMDALRAGPLPEASMNVYFDFAEILLKRAGVVVFVAMSSTPVLII